jgi:hypothetical protein
VSSSAHDTDAQVWEECGFWKVYTGEIRRPADSALSRFRWVARLLARAAVICIRFAWQPRRRKPPAAPCELLLVYVTANQRHSFSAWIGTGPNVQTASQMQDADWDIPWFRCGLLMLRYAWPVYRTLRSRDDHVLTIPWYEEFVRFRVGLVLADDLYRRARPRVVAVSNDHSGMFRAFIKEARRHGCKLVYTQHASIGRNLPALQFDLTLLDGAQAYLHYRESGVPTGSVVITGRNRPQTHARTGQRELTIGLATNLDDSIAEWTPVLRTVSQQFPQVTLRCHPAETRKLAWRGLASACGVRMDTGSLADFLRGTSVLISGMSGIILDAALWDIPCLIKLSSLRVSDAMKDYYGYERFGLCTPIGEMVDLPDLIRSVSQRPADITRVAVYEAGLVVDPAEEKRAALEIFMQCLERGLDPEAGLRKRYASVMCGESSVLMPAPYVELSQRYGWLTGACA